MTTEILNLYAGIGGNRKLWDEVEDIDVTAVEWDEDKAQVYRDHFPNDTVEVTDAHEYLLENFRNYDFIWSSPPCQTHSSMQQVSVMSDTHCNEGREAKYPDMNLYQEVVLLSEFFDGDYVVENVQPYYEPLIDAQKVHRHLFWSNFHISEIELEADQIKWSENKKKKWRDRTGFDIRPYTFETARKDQVRHNTMNPKLGKHVFASRGKQATLF